MSAPQTPTPERYTAPALEDQEQLLFTEGINFFELPDGQSFMGEQRQGLVALCVSADIAGVWMDLGAGDGRYANLLLERCDRVVALDADRSALSKLWHRTPASDRAKIELLVHNVATSPLPLADESLDGVLCVGLLHYFPAAVVRGVLAEVTRILKPGGTLLLEFSTDVERVPVGSDEGLERGAEHRFDAAQALLAKALKPAFAYEMRTERVDRKPMLLLGRAFTWSSTDIHVVATKGSAVGEP